MRATTVKLTLELIGNEQGDFVNFTILLKALRERLGFRISFYFVYAAIRERLPQHQSCFRIFELGKCELIKYSFEKHAQPLSVTRPVTCSRKFRFKNSND
jgi:hypothetical protein